MLPEEGGKVPRRHQKGERQGEQVQVWVIGQRRGKKLGLRIRGGDLKSFRDASDITGTERLS